LQLIKAIIAKSIKSFFIGCLILHKTTSKND